MYLKTPLDNGQVLNLIPSKGVFPSIRKQSKALRIKNYFNHPLR